MSDDHLNAITSLATGQNTLSLTLMHPTSMRCSLDLPCLNSSLYGISQCSKVSTEVGFSCGWPMACNVVANDIVDFFISDATEEREIFKFK